MIALLLACADPLPMPSALAADCPTWEPPARDGTLDRALKEVSDLAARPGGWWAHNDSGDQGRLYALDATGARVATVDLGVDAYDWEDMAVLDRDGARTLFVADTGDNEYVRSEVAVVHLPEPPAVDGAVAAARTAYTYPGGARHNAEALLADPRDGSLWLLTKSDDGVSELFVDRAPLDPGPRTWASEGALVFGGAALPGSPKVTSADMAPDGSAIAVRTYESAYWWRVEPEQSVADALREPPCVLPARDEKQGESIVLLADGGFATVSEGKKSAIWRAARAP